MNIDQFGHGIDREMRLMLLKICLCHKLRVSVVACNVLASTCNSSCFRMIWQRLLLDCDSMGLTSLFAVVKERVRVQVSRMVIDSTFIHIVFLVHSLSAYFGWFLVIDILRSISIIIPICEWLFLTIPELSFIWLTICQVFEIVLNCVGSLNANKLILQLTIRIYAFSQFLWILFLTVDRTRKNSINQHALIKRWVLLLSCSRLHLILALNTLSFLFRLEKLGGLWFFVRLIHLLQVEFLSYNSSNFVKWKWLNTILKWNTYFWNLFTRNFGRYLSCLTIYPTRFDHGETPGLLQISFTGVTESP